MSRYEQLLFLFVVPLHLKKRSQAALGNIKQAYIALVCTDFAQWKGERPFTGQKESHPDHTENFNLPVKVYLLIFKFSSLSPVPAE